MAKNLSPKCRLCRRAGEKLFLKGDRCSSAKCAIVKRNYPPGFHGSKKTRRLTDYGKQLAEKQKAKRQYNMLEKQFKLTFEHALKHGGNTGENFIKLLEMRLDNVIYRLGLAPSRSAARQMVNHGLFTVNDKRMNIPSYSVRVGDIIKIKSNKINNKNFKNLDDKLKQFKTPGWLHFDVAKKIAKILHKPSVKDVSASFDVQVVVEYYSR